MTDQSSTLHPSRPYKRSLGRSGMSSRRNTGQTYYQYQQTPNQTYIINRPRRAHQTTIFRLRTHHAPLNAHLHRIKKELQSKCVYCPDSDEHFPFHCQLYNIRTRLLPAQPKWIISTQRQQTATYTISATNRRDKIVRSLGRGARKVKPSSGEA